MKEEPTILGLYDPTAETRISADASSYGLGAVILQKTKGWWRPIAFASRALTETERRYAQIEKEALATVWACDKFSDYILGKAIKIETDHKPLVPLLGNKQLDNLPPRELRFRLRTCLVQLHHPQCTRETFYMADALSRAPVSLADEESDALEKELEYFLEATVACMHTGKPGQVCHRTSKGSFMHESERILHRWVAKKEKACTGVETLLGSLKLSNPSKQSSSSWQLYCGPSFIEKGNTAESPRGIPRPGKVQTTCQKCSLVARNAELGGGNSSKLPCSC